MTFAASSNCVLYCGGKPVFSDIQEDTANIDPLRVEKKISKKTKAIIPVHFSGHPADLETIRNIARRHKLLVIEDAAHALGAEYKGSKAGCCRYSDMAILSFHPVKHIATGEGGAVLTNRKDLYVALTMLRNHGITKDRSRFTGDGSPAAGPWYYEQQYLGFNYRITDFQCAMGISQLSKLDSFISRRREIARIYSRVLAGIGLIDLPVERKYAKPAWHLYPIRLKGIVKNRKKEIFNGLRARGIGVQVHYLPVYRHPYYRRLGYKRGLCPKAEEFYQREISIPLYPAMKKAEINHVIDTLTEVFSKYAR